MASSSSGSGNGKLAEIHIPLRNAQDTQISTIHAMPFNTDFNGHVPMKAFFNSTICTSDTSALRNILNMDLPKRLPPMDLSEDCTNE